MSLVSTIEALQKRTLTTEEAACLNDFQQFFHLDDDDPLMVVLALMARSQLIVETVPNLLQQKVNETIELHRTVLRDQAVLISKELIGNLTQHIQAANADWKGRWIRYVSCFAAGVLASALGFWWIVHVAR